MPSLMPMTQMANAPPCNTDGALLPFVLSNCFLRAINLRFTAILPVWPACVLFFTLALILDNPFCCVLSIFSSFFYCIFVVFMLFLRSSSFASLLLLDESAFYLIANYCHSEGGREAERNHGLFTAFWHPAAFVSILACLALCCKGDQQTPPSVMRLCVPQKQHECPPVKIWVASLPLSIKINGLILKYMGLFGILVFFSLSLCHD